ncbi:MAG: cyclase family protein [Acidobacteriaceae bacterium]|nr:cyclase family protein [Acidobacteriaceae bacterium]
MTAAGRWMDVSVPLSTGLVHWPGDPEPTFSRISDMEHGAEANVTLCRMTAHTGTHMDAPCHFIPGQTGIDQFPIETGIGAARVIEIATGARVVSDKEFRDNGIGPGERILLKTRNSGTRWWEHDFDTGFAAIDASGAQFLATAGVKLIGVDYLSVGFFQRDGAETHRTLLSAGIWILEGLDLTNIDPGEYDMVCLPLRIVGADGSPARVVLRRR